MPTANELGTQFRDSIADIPPVIDHILDVWGTFIELRKQITEQRRTDAAWDEADSPTFVRLDLRRHEQRLQANLEHEPWKPRSENASRYLRATLCIADMYDQCTLCRSLIDGCKDVLASGHVGGRMPLLSDLQNEVSRLESFVTPRAVGLTQDGMIDDQIADLPQDADAVPGRMRQLRDELAERQEWPVPLTIVLDPQKYEYPLARAVFVAVGDCLCAGRDLGNAVGEVHRLVDRLDRDRGLIARYTPASPDRSRAFEMTEDSRTRLVWEACDEYFRALGGFDRARRRLRQCCNEGRAELDATSSSTELTTNQLLKHLSHAGQFMPDIQMLGHRVPLDAAMPEIISSWLQKLADMGEQLRHIAFAEKAVGTGEPLGTSGAGDGRASDVGLDSGSRSTNTPVPGGEGGRRLPWTQERVDDQIRQLKSAHAGIYASLADRHMSGDRKAPGEARELFGRNRIAKKFGISKPMVSKSSAWRAMAAELGLGKVSIPLRTKVGFDIAVERTSGKEADPMNLAAADELKAHLKTLRERDRKALIEGLKSGKNTPDQALKIARLAATSKSAQDV